MNKITMKPLSTAKYCIFIYIYVMPNILTVRLSREEEDVIRNTKDLSLIERKYQCFFLIIQNIYFI